MSLVQFAGRDARLGTLDVPTAFGPLPLFVAAHMPSAARGSVTGVVREEAACLRQPGRALAAPPFSGPRSRGTPENGTGQRHQCKPGSRAARTPRMGPAPGGTTTALCTEVACQVLACHPCAGAGGLGCGRRPHSRCPGSCQAWLLLMEPLSASRLGCPASVGRRTHPRPSALAPEPACAQPRTAAKGRKRPVSMQGSFMRCGSRETRWIN
jgi:hypothetical protein